MNASIRTVVFIAFAYIYSTSFEIIVCHCCVVV